jgi:hypothetical protein
LENQEQEEIQNAIITDSDSVIDTKIDLQQEEVA